MRKILLSPKFYLPLIIVVGAALRFPCLFNDFDLDEVWSFNIVYALKSPLQIFTQCLMDTNHPLNSLFIYLTGHYNPLPLFKFRILSFIFGLGTIFLTFLLSSKITGNKKMAAMAAALAAVSFPLVIYSSIARGYSAVVFFSAASVYLLFDYLHSSCRKTLLLFYACYIFGFLSHLTFIFMAAALVITASLYLMRTRVSLKKKFLALFNIFFIPTAIVLIVLGKFFLKLDVGGGAAIPLLKTVKSTILSIAGLSEINAVTYILLAVIIAILSTEIVYLLKHYTDLGILIASVVFLTIVSVLFIRHKYEYALFRHFLYLYPFLLILFSHFLYRLVKINIRAKILAAIFASLILIANLQQIGYFLKGGARFRAAMYYIYGHTKSPKITITSDNDFKNYTLINFYDHFFFGGKKLIYVSFKNLLEEKTNPEWIIKYVDAEEYEPPTLRFLKLNGCRYALEKCFLSYGIFSGFYWVLYHKLG